MPLLEPDPDYKTFQMDFIFLQKKKIKQLVLELRKENLLAFFKGDTGLSQDKDACLL